MDDSYRQRYGTLKEIGGGEYVLAAYPEEGEKSLTFTVYPTKISQEGGLAIDLEAAKQLKDSLEDFISKAGT